MTRNPTTPSYKAALPRPLDLCPHEGTQRNEKRLDSVDQDPETLYLGPKRRFPIPGIPLIFHGMQHFIHEMPVFFHKTLSGHHHCFLDLFFSSL